MEQKNRRKQSLIALSSMVSSWSSFRILGTVASNDVSNSWPSASCPGMMPESRHNISSSDTRSVLCSDGIISQQVESTLNLTKDKKQRLVSWNVRLHFFQDLLSAHLFPAQSISPVSRSTINVSSGIFLRTADASPSDVPSSWIPTKIEPGKFKHPMKGWVNLGTYGAQSSNGKSSDRSSSHTSKTNDG